MKEEDARASITNSYEVVIKVLMMDLICEGIQYGRQVIVARRMRISDEEWNKAMGVSS
jgi:hypothetical protein